MGTSQEVWILYCVAINTTSRIAMPPIRVIVNAIYTTIDGFTVRYDIIRNMRLQYKIESANQVGHVKFIVYCHTRHFIPYFI